LRGWNASLPDPQPSLFGSELQPPGFYLRHEFVDAEEARALVQAIGRLEFSKVEMRGGVAKRRTVHYGWTYAYGARSTEPGVEVPAFLLPLRARAAAWAGIEPDAFAEALVTEYPAGAGIGWHRDAPMFGSRNVGVSLAAPARMRFRRTVKGEREVAAIELAPRSAYVLAGRARWSWQHSIAPAKALRYSVTFRSLKRSKDGR
jgi:DNA oxidative demethylase